MKLKYFILLLLSSFLLPGQIAIDYENDDAGDAQFISCGSASAIDDLPDGAAITVSAWVYTTGLTYAPTSSVIAAKANSGTPGGWNMLVLDVVDRFANIVRFDGATDMNLQYNTSTFTPNTWIHVYATVAANAVALDSEMYQNGSEPACCAASTNGAGNYDTDAADSLISGFNFDGLIACWALYAGDGTAEDADMFTSVGRENCKTASYNWSSLGHPLVFLDLVGVDGDSVTIVDPSGNCTPSVNGSPVLAEAQ